MCWSGNYEMTKVPSQNDSKCRKIRDHGSEVKVLLGASWSDNYQKSHNKHQHRPSQKFSFCTSFPFGKFIFLQDSHSHAAMSNKHFWFRIAVYGSWSRLISLEKLFGKRLSWWRLQRSRRKMGRRAGASLLSVAQAWRLLPGNSKFKKVIETSCHYLLHRARRRWFLHLAFLRPWHSLPFKDHVNQFLHFFRHFPVARVHRIFVDHVTILRADSWHDNEFWDFLKVPDGRRAHVGCIRLSNRRVSEPRVEDMLLTHDVELQSLERKTFVWVGIWLFQVSITAKLWAADKATKKTVTNITSL